MSNYCKIKLRTSHIMNCSIVWNRSGQSVPNISLWVPFQRCQISKKIPMPIAWEPVRELGESWILHMVYCWLSISCCQLLSVTSALSSLVTLVTDLSRHIPLTLGTWHLWPTPLACIRFTCSRHLYCWLYRLSLRCWQRESPCLSSVTCHLCSHCTVDCSYK